LILRVAQVGPKTVTVKARYNRFANGVRPPKITGITTTGLNCDKTPALHVGLVLDANGTFETCDMVAPAEGFQVILHHNSAGSPASYTLQSVDGKEAGEAVVEVTQQQKGWKLDSRVRVSNQSFLCGSADTALGYLPPSSLRFCGENFKLTVPDDV
jgi:hypothetical protein